MPASRIPAAHWMSPWGFHGHHRGGAAGARIGLPGTPWRPSGLPGTPGTFLAPEGQSFILQNEVLFRIASTPPALKIAMLRCRSSTRVFLMP